MNQFALCGKRPKEKYHSYKGDVGKVADNIINRDFSTEKPLQKWTTDVSQFNLPWGKCYISPILDMNTNEIISYNLSTSPNMEQIKDMLNKAFERFPSVQGLIMHSDQGWQYQHAFYRSELQKHGIIQSMSRKGNCYDNCIMETFFGRLKNEMFYGGDEHYALALLCLVYRAQDMTLVEAVKVTRRLVKHNHRRIAEERPGETYSLLLAVGEQISELTDICVIALGQSHDEIMDRSFLRRFNDLLMRGVVIGQK